MFNIDKWFETKSRDLAKGSSRRSFLARFGVALVGASSLPLLPVSRLSNTAYASAKSDTEAYDSGAEIDPGDPKDCQYWRYCAIDGFLCACCGGSVSSCPPGTVLSPITWIGTCQNPGDGKHYIISYNDCCGQSGCGQCTCNRNERDRPIYMPHQANDINWCAGSSRDIVYNCSIAAIIGIDEKAS